MSSPSVSTTDGSVRGVPSGVSEVLAGLKRRIRLYVVVEGTALVVVLLGILFWFSLGLDWAWFRISRLEMPVWLRMVFDLAVLSGAVAVAVGWIGLRLARQYRSRGLALVLERRFPELDDRLITSIEMADGAETSLTPLGQAMLERTRRDVAEASRRLDTSDVFQKTPLKRAVLLAVALVMSIGGLAAADAAVMSRWASGFLGLQETYWPRDYDLVVSVVRGPSRPDVLVSAGTAYRHPRGEDLVLSITVRPKSETLAPLDNVQVTYRQADATGRGMCARRSDHEFRFTRAGLLEDMTFWVQGGDYVNRMPYRVQVVDAPTLEQIVLDCRFPEYTGLNPQNSSRVAVQGIQVDIPLETNMVFQARTNKPIVGVRVEFDSYRIVIEDRNGEAHAWFERESEEGQSVLRRTLSTGSLLKQSEGGVEWPTRILKLPLAMGTNAQETLGKLFDPQQVRTGTPLEAAIPLPPDTQLRISVLDTDDIRSRDPSRLTINGIVDQPPEIETSLKGIGTEVTRIARIPVSGLIRDDYGVDEVHFEYQVVDGDTRPDQLTGEWLMRPLARPPTDRPREFELSTAKEDVPRDDALKEPRHERAAWFDLRQLDPEPTVGQKLMLTIVASDADDKNGPHRTRSSPVHVFKIVSNEDLQFALIQKELRFRQSFEQVIGDTERTRKNLLAYRRQVTESDSAGADSGEPGEQVNPAERSINEVIRGQNETVAIREGFADIRDELINNGVHTPQTLTRIDSGVLKPLLRIIDEDYTGAEAALRDLARASRDGSTPSPEKIDAATDALQTLLARMKSVLREMMKLETYQEALKLLKQIIDDEEKLLEKTREERKRELIKKLNGLDLGGDSKPGETPKNKNP